MRVNELAKALKVPGAEVMKQAEVLRIEVYSALSSLDTDDVSRLKAHFMKRSQAEQTGAEQARLERRAEKQRLVDEAAAEKKTRERAALDKHLAAAQEADSKFRTAPKTDAAPKVVEAPAPVTEAAPEAPAPVEAPVAETTKPEAAAPTAEKAPEAPAPTAPATPAQPATAASAKVKPAKPGRVHIEDEEDEVPSNVHVPAGTMAKERAGSSKAPLRPVHAHRGREIPQGRKEEGGVRRDFGFVAGKAHPHPQAPAAKPAAPAAAAQQSIQLSGAVTVKEIAEKMGVRPNRVIADLMQMNILAAINQRIEPSIAEKIATKYGFRIDVEKSRRSTERKPIIKSENADDEIPPDSPESLIPRPPVVTFLGHVDHGKTSLMDRIRNTKVASGEAGGITQHIGAYTVDVSGRAITFLDTPGHAAFSSMRARGASLTDIAVIIIAADDGIMPQTKEAIKHAKHAGVQIMVAVNKCDLPTARPDRVRQMLQAEGLTPEEWGGDIVVCDVSAHTGAGVDHLLDMIILQADVLELSANPTRRANGSVIEAQVEQGLGPTATLLVTGGTLNVGDTILCGEFFGRIRGLIDERGRRVKSAGPSIAVRCMGLSGVPEAGAEFRVMPNEKRARALAEEAAHARKHAELSSAQMASMADWTTRFGADGKAELAVIIKADTQGSAEAIVQALNDTLKSEKVTLNVVYAGIGNIAPTDVQRATGGKAMIIGFNISCEPGVQAQARHDGVRVNTFRIIYELLEHVRECMLDLVPPEYKEVIKGHAEIRQVFDIGKKGRIAGCQLLDGSLRIAAKFRISRRKEIVYTGKVNEMRHFQSEVTEITGAQECGLRFEGFEQFEAGDIVECFDKEMLPKSL